jgi:serine/threonine protein kinase
MNGGTLSELISREGLMSAADTVSIIAKLADALAEAHSHDIIHRDIKPQNILFSSTTSSREPKIADFGIAKSYGEAGVNNRANDTKLVAGYPLAMYSPSWAAPEQLAGIPTGPETDIYSLALVAIYMLSGRVVFNAPSAMEGYTKRAEFKSLVPAALERASITEATADTLLRATEYDMHRRPQNAAEFGKLLRDSLTKDDTTQPHRPRAQLVAVEGGGQQAQVPSSPPLRLTRGAKSVGQRACQFIEMQDSVTTLAFGGAKVQFTSMLVGPLGRSIHLKGLNAFVSRVGGRPTSGLNVQEDTDIDLVDLRNKPLMRLHLSFGQPAAGHTIFQLGQESVALDASECPNPILVDSPSQNQSFFVHARGAGANEEDRKRRR